MRSIPASPGARSARSLRRVDKFLKEPLASAFEERERRAEMVDKAAVILDKQVEKVKSAGSAIPS